MNWNCTVQCTLKLLNNFFLTYFIISYVDSPFHSDPLLLLNAKCGQTLYNSTWDAILTAKNRNSKRTYLNIAHIQKKATEEEKINARTTESDYWLQTAIKRLRSKAIRDAGGSMQLGEFKIKTSEMW